MTFDRAVSRACCAGLILLSETGIITAALQKETTSASQLPEELRGAKVYQLPEESTPGQPAENPVIYRSMSYEDINFERLVLNLFLAVKPVERSATIREIYFQNVRVNGVPVHIETFDQEFSVSKNKVVDLPAPLKCAIVFSDLDSVAPLKQIVSEDTIQITGLSFIEVKLNTIEKIALRSKRLVLPVTLTEKVPLQMFSGSPLLQMAATKILDTLSDPSSAAALALAREHLAKLAGSRTLRSIGEPSLYFIYCEYALRDPKTHAEEKLSQTGTGFVVSGDGRLLTAKRVVQPWKFDPQIAFLISRYHLEFVPEAYRLLAWPAGAKVLAADGKPDFETGFSTEKKALKALKTAPDRMEKQDYQDPDTGVKTTLSLHTPGQNDAALLQLQGKSFQPLAFAASAPVGGGLQTTLFGFPYGLNQSFANPEPIPVTAVTEGSSITIEHQLNPGETGAPLLNPEGKVLALAAGANECIPIAAVRTLIQ